MDRLVPVNDAQLGKGFLLFLLKLPWQKMVKLRRTEAFTQYNICVTTHTLIVQNK